MKNALQVIWITVRQTLTSQGSFSKKRDGICPVKTTRLQQEWDELKKNVIRDAKQQEGWKSITYWKNGIYVNWLNYGIITNKQEIIIYVINLKVKHRQFEYDIVNSSIDMSMVNWKIVLSQLMEELRFPIDWTTIILFCSNQKFDKDQKTGIPRLPRSSYLIHVRLQVHEKYGKSVQWYHRYKN